MLEKENAHDEWSMAYSAGRGRFGVQRIFHKERQERTVARSQLQARGEIQPQDAHPIRAGNGRAVACGSQGPSPRPQDESLKEVVGSTELESVTSCVSSE